MSGPSGVSGLFQVVPVKFYEFSQSLDPKHYTLNLKL